MGLFLVRFQKKKGGGNPGIRGTSINCGVYTSRKLNLKQTFSQTDRQDPILTFLIFFKLMYYF